MVKRNMIEIGIRLLSPYCRLVENVGSSKMPISGKTYPPERRFPENFDLSLCRFLEDFI